MIISRLINGRKKLAFLFLIILCTHVACRPTSVTTTTRLDSVVKPTPTMVYDHYYPTPLPTVEWTPESEELRSNILGEACAMPCWYGIVPGQTPADEIPQILDELKERGILEKYNRGAHSSYFIYYSLQNIGGLIGFDEERNIVTSITFGVHSKFITLNDVLNTFGPPELIANGSDILVGFYLGYPKEEIFVWVETDFSDEEALTPDMTVVYLRYLSEHANNHEINSPNIAWFEWEGYQTFDYYYDKFYPMQESPQD